MEVKIDLSKVNKHSMVSVLQDNFTQINEAYATGSVSALFNTVDNLFKSADINTKASNRLLNNIKRSTTALMAMYTITNSMQAGWGNAVV